MTRAPAVGARLTMVVRVVPVHESHLRVCHGPKQRGAFTFPNNLEFKQNN